MSKVSRLTAAFVFFALAPSAWAGFGVGSPTNVQPKPGDLVLVDALSPLATLIPDDGSRDVEVDMFAMHALYPTFSQEVLAVGGKLRLDDVEVRYEQDGVEGWVVYPELVLEVSAECATFADRVVPPGVVDPDLDGVVDAGALRDWLEASPCG